MQTNAPAGSEFVDQFERAVVFGQVNKNILPPEKIGAVSSIFASNSTQISTAANINDQIVSILSFPGGCLGKTGCLEFQSWATRVANQCGCRVRLWISNSSTLPTSGSTTGRIVNYPVTTGSSNISIFRGGLLFLTGSSSSFISQPAASNGTGAAVATTSFETNATVSGPIDFDSNFFLYFGLQKDVITDTLTHRYSRVTATYGA